MQNTFYFKVILFFSSITLLYVLAYTYGLIEYAKVIHPILNQTHGDFKRDLETEIVLPEHGELVKMFYKTRETWVTSNLGTYLFKNVDHNTIDWLGQPTRFFKVMIWKDWDWLKRRHSDSLDECSVNNCIFSGDPDFESADAVIVHIQHGIFPTVKERNRNQIWIFLADESPKNAFSLAKKTPKIAEIANIFNWSMTYRSDADIPVPYGRTIPLPYPKMNNLTYKRVIELIPHWNIKRYDTLATVLMSNCKPNRLKFLEELKKYMDIDVYGGCAKDENKKACPGHFRRDCKIMSNYLFYLVMENSNCRQYISEKSFHHAYEKGAIPVFIGAPLEDCNKLLPPNSFLHIEHFKSIKHLALEMIALSQNLTKLLEYHVWRNNFQILNEHGYLESPSVHLCRVCEALNYNDGTRKVYDEDEIRLFLDAKLLCSDSY